MPEQWSPLIRNRISPHDACLRVLPVCEHCESLRHVRGPIARLDRGVLSVRSSNPVSLAPADQGAGESRAAPESEASVSSINWPHPHPNPPLATESTGTH